MMTLFLLSGSKQWMLPSLRLHCRSITKPFTINWVYGDVSRHGARVDLPFYFLGLCRQMEGAWVLR